jgi:hypothetical protein
MDEPNQNGDQLSDGTLETGRLAFDRSFWARPE